MAKIIGIYILFGEKNLTQMEKLQKGCQHIFLNTLSYPPSMPTIEEQQTKKQEYLNSLANLAARKLNPG